MKTGMCLLFILPVYLLFNYTVPHCLADTQGQDPSESHNADTTNNSNRPDNINSLIYFDQQIVQPEKHENQRRIKNILDDITALEKDYNEALDKDHVSIGLYGVGAFDNDIQDDENRYRLRLEWRLFNDGYFESLQQDQKKILQTKLEFYQLRRDMIERSLEDVLFRLFTVENLVNYLHFKEKFSKLDKLLTRRTRQREQGFTTETDLLNIKRQLRETKANLELYEKSEKGFLGQDELNLLNNLEKINLKDKELLLSQAQKNSLDIKIQDNFIDRSKFYPSWLDDLGINLYVSQQNEYDAKERNVMGIEVEIPLDPGHNKDEIIGIQQQIYRNQKEAIEVRLKQKLDKLFSFFFFQKMQLRNLCEEVSFSLVQKQIAAQKRMHTIQNLDTDPDRDLELTEIKLLDLRNDILLSRLRLYEMVLKIMTLTQCESITDLCEFESDR